MTVRFNSEQEFSEELEKDHLKIDRRIVRITGSYTESKLSSDVHFLFAVATYSVEGQIIELEKDCGEIWGAGHRNGIKARRQYQKVHKVISETVTRCGCELRAGCLVER